MEMVSKEELMSDPNLMFSKLVLAGLNRYKELKTRYPTESFVYKLN